MPTAAKIASSSVGGSRRTRRFPYLVFQSSLIGASSFGPRYLGALMLHCNMNLARQSSYALTVSEALWLYCISIVGFVRRILPLCHAVRHPTLISRQLLILIFDSGFVRALHRPHQLIAADVAASA